MNIIDIIRRSANNHPLTPMERAFLKFLQGALFGVVIDAANIMIAYYQGGGTSTSVDWLHLLLIPLGTGFLSALIKWYSAQGDTDVAAALTLVKTTVAPLAQRPVQPKGAPDVPVPPPSRTPPQAP